MADELTFGTLFNSLTVRTDDNDESKIEIEVDSGLDFVTSKTLDREQVKKLIDYLTQWYVANG